MARPIAGNAREAYPGRKKIMNANEAREFWKECKREVLNQFSREDTIEKVLIKSRKLGPTIEPWVACSFKNCRNRDAKTVGDAIKKIDAQFGLS